MSRIRFAAVAAALLGSACQAPQAPPSPESAQTAQTAPAAAAPASQAPAAATLDLGQYVKADDTLLARKEFDLLGDGNPQTVLIVRHGGKDASQMYPCQLLILRKDASAYAVAASSDKVVDCFFNEVAKNAKDLSDNLKLSKDSLVYVNQGEKSSTTYSFKYSAETSGWRLDRAESHYSVPSETSDDLDSYEETAAYPKDFALISLADFDPARIEDAMRANKKKTP